MRGLYTYLNEIKFEERINERIELLNKARHTNNFESVNSSFVTTNHYFGIVRDLYEKILEDIEKELKC